MDSKMLSLLFELTLIYGIKDFEQITSVSVKNVFYEGVS